MWYFRRRHFPSNVSALVRAAIVRAEAAPGPIEFITASSDLERAPSVNHHGGLRNPHLTRDAARPDVLSHILAPCVGSQPKEVPE